MTRIVLPILAALLIVGAGNRSTVTGSRQATAALAPMRARTAATIRSQRWPPNA